ncbi:MAG TPA: DUF3237 domain-containing protein [Burkholderiales bacterium]
MNLEPLFRAEITLAPAQELGDAPLGRRRIVPITGGRFQGERLRGRVLAGGADWQIVRADGVAQLEAHYTLETSDGALVYVHNVGLRHGPPEVLERIAAGEAVDPALYYMRATPRFETGDPRYRWLNRLVCVATGARRRDSVELDVYEVK